MIFLLIVILYLLIGALLVTVNLSNEENHKDFEKNVHDITSSNNMSRGKACALLICTAILLWPMIVKSIRFKK